MPSVERSATVYASREAVWDFVKDMDNWAPFLRGYQSHKRISDDESIWLLRGNLGGLTRVAEFRVLIVEWSGPDRVRFELEGLNEPMSGSGSFASTAAPSVTPVETETPRPAGLQRLWRNLWAKLVRLALAGSAPNPRAPPANAGLDQTTVTFQLSLSVAGTSGKIIDLLIAPMLAPVAEELIAKIANAIDAPIDADRCSDRYQRRV